MKTSTPASSSKPEKVTLTAREIELIKQDAAKLEASLSARDMRYLQSLNRFMYNGGRNESIRSLYVYPSNYLYQGVDDGRTGPLPSINIGRSMALTLQSKLIQTKGRLFFSASNGLGKPSRCAGMLRCTSMRSLSATT